VLEKNIYFGLHTGYLKSSWERTVSEEFDCLDVKGPGLFEATYNCEYVTDGDNIYYRYRIPTDSDKKVKSVEFKAEKGREDKFIIKSISVQEGE